MAVENKFKLNVLAASVLMGLSLSAVAAPVTGAKSDVKDTATAAKDTATAAKTLADSVVGAVKTSTDGEGVKTGVALAVSAKKITVGNENTALSDVLKNTLGGEYVPKGDNDTSKKKSYTDAAGKLGVPQQHIESAYNEAKANLEKAANTFASSEVAVKAAGVDKIYNNKLIALYGGVEDAPNSLISINENRSSKADGSEASADLISGPSEGSLFKAYMDAVGNTASHTGGLSEAFNNLLVQATKDSSAGTSGGADLSSGWNDEAKKARHAVAGYLAYLKADSAVKLNEAKKTAAEQYIQEKLPAFLKVIEANSKADGNFNADKNENNKLLNSKYKEFTDAVNAYQASASEDNKKTVIMKLKALATAADTGTQSAIKVPVSGDQLSLEVDKKTVSDFQIALTAAAKIRGDAVTALGSTETTGALKDLADASKWATSAASADYPAALSSSGHLIPIADSETALAGLKTYMQKLIKKAKDADGPSGASARDNLDSLIQAASSAEQTYQSTHLAYQNGVKELNEAGTLRTSLNAELKTLHKKYSEAADAYNAALADYRNESKGTEGTKVETLVSNLNQKKADYISELEAQSANIKKALIPDNTNSIVDEYKTALKSAGEKQDAKNTALYTLIGKQKELVSAKLSIDTALLNLQQKDMQVKTDAIVKAEKGKTDAENQYNAAVAEYLAAKNKSDTDADKANHVANEVAVAAAEVKLKAFTAGGKGELSELYVDTSNKKNGLEKGFKQFNQLDKNSPALKALSDAQKELYIVGTNDTPVSANKGSGIQKARLEIVDSMNRLASLMPLATADEQTKYRIAYSAALDAVKNTDGDAAAQSQLANAESTTHYLGNLSQKQLTAFNTSSGKFNSIIVNDDGKGNLSVKDSFTAKDLYTGTQDKPFTTTVLDVRALELGNGATLADTNTITVGEAAAKGKKATPIDVWAKTAGVKHANPTDDSSDYVTAENGPAVKLSGDLRTATAQLDANGAPVKDTVVRGADQIHLQNVNIHNSFTLADKVKMMADDLAALNKEAVDRITLGQPADGEGGVKTWVKKQNGLLDSKYDKLELTGLQIDTTTVNPEFDLKEGVWTKAAKTAIPTEASIVLDHVNIALQNDSVGGKSTAIDVTGSGNHILAKDGVFDAGLVTGKGSYADVLKFTGANNLVDFNGSVLKGDIHIGDTGAAGNTVNLINGSLTGNADAYDGTLTLALNGSTWTGASGRQSPDVSLSNNSVWNVKAFGGTAPSGVTGPYSSVRALSLYGNNTINLVSSEGQAQLGGHGFAGSASAVTLHVDDNLTSDGKGVTSVLAGTYSPGNLHSLTNAGLADGYKFGTLYVDGLAKGFDGQLSGGQYRLSVESAGAEPYTVGGRLADGSSGTSAAHAFASYKTSENRVVMDESGKPVTQNVASDADFTTLSVPAELGVYQYAAEKVMDAANNRTSIFYSSTGQLSNSAATAVSLASAPVDVTKLESDSLAKHMNSVRHGKDSGVWLSYYGGETRNTTAAGPEYTLKTNGVMVGADALTENNWLAGVAVSSARSDMSVMNSSGNLNSYGAQFYLSRRYDSGVFVDGALQFNHFSNTAKARMINGQQAKADFSGNSYGLNGKVGYAWNSEGFFAEPYVRAAARVFDGEHYALSNGMTVDSNEYKSMLGEVGADLGYQYDISGGYLKPYLHLAALNEFADGNSVRVNNVSLDNSVKGSAFQAGLGAEVKVTDNLGGYAAFDYTKGSNTERPWQANVGVNYTW